MRAVRCSRCTANAYAARLQLPLLVRQLHALAAAAAGSLDEDREADLPHLVHEPLQALVLAVIPAKVAPTIQAQEQ